jgi:hypothetical protein
VELWDIWWATIKKDYGCGRATKKKKKSWGKRVAMVGIEKSCLPLDNVYA